uniref:Uncharacterized protein n=2 Tax=Guillardia theta TaxID=55529 RepID=A0A7S4PN71_GUITH|mmetsp:Transcript_6593/g.23307  ORF Transcript_6593/g.23307 Transcript_6593/m.23307 type:complete len:399 (+) Transcript_6593:134-1330(+)
MPEGNDATREIYDDDTRVFDSYQGETSKADQDFFNDQSAVNEEILQMVLDMDFGFVLTAMDKFSTGLKRDLSRCLRVDEYRVSIKNVSSGSVVVVVAILPGREDEKTPRELVQELRDQATMAESRLFAGVYSSRLKKISSLTGEFFEVECHHIDKKDGKNDSHSSGHFSFARDDPPARKSIPAGLDNSRVRSSMSSRSGAGADRSRDDRTTPQKSASSSSPTAQADGTGVATPSVGQAAAGGRQSMGTPSFATPSPLGQTTDTRGLQVTNMAFEPVHVEVFKRSGESIIKAEVPPNGCFPSGDVNSIWRIPAGKDVCFAVFLPSEPEYRRTFCLPEFDRRSVRVRVEIDPTRRTVMVSPQMKKGQQIQGNIDAYSLRLNMIQDSTAKFNSNSLFADEQ